MASLGRQTLDLQIDETDPDLKEMRGGYSEFNAFQVFKRYLQSSDEELSIDEAADQLFRMLPTDSEIKESGFSSTSLGHVILDVAQQVPYSHPAQVHLVRLLLWLRESRNISLQFGDQDQKRSFFASMEGFRLTMRERFGPNFETSAEERYYVNTCAFHARLLSSGFIDTLSFAIWTMRENLEDGYPPELGSDDEGACISGAAMWILCAGQRLWTEIVQCPRTENPRAEKTWRQGSLYQGPVFGLERWRFWEKAFAVAAENTNLSTECQQLASRAADLMNIIERTSL